MAKAGASSKGLQRAVERSGALMAEGRFRRVLKELQPYLKGDHTPLPAAYFAGLAHHGLGDVERSRQFLGLVLRVDPGGEAGLFARALLCMDAGEHATARTHLLRLLRQQPRSPEILNTLGLCERADGRLADAIRCWSAALSTTPGHVASFQNLLDSLHGVGHLKEARAAIKRFPEDALNKNPELAAAAMALEVSSGDFTAARARLFALSAAVRRSAPVQKAAARLHSIEGETDSALAAAEAALRANPQDLASAMTLFELSDRHASPETARRRALICARDAFEALTAKSATTPLTLLNLGSLMEKQGAFEEAAHCYRRGNTALLRQLSSIGIRYPSAAFEACAADAEAWAETVAAISSHAGQPSGALPDAIFIVGLPRSGTSLIERILNAHPNLMGIGESPALPDVAERLGLGRVDSPVPDAARRAAALDEDARRAARAAYFQAAGLPKGSPIPVDKLMYNSIFAPFILTIFERPLILWLSRDFADTAVSVLSKNFIGCYPFTCDAGLLRHYHDQTGRVLAACQLVAPGRVLPISYEGLVRAGSNGIRDLIARVGLPWSDTCLDYRAQGGRVMTASRDQVREEISDRSIGRAGPFLPIMPELADRRETPKSG